MNGDEEMMKDERWRGGWLVGFSDSIMMMRDGIPSLSVAVFCFSFFSFLLSFLSCFSFLSPAHIWGEKSGSMGSTH